MALPRNSLLASIFVAAVCLSTPVLADDSTLSGRPVHRSDYLDDNYIYDFMNHRDSITIGLGDAPTSNLVIMHPTPWPSYINNTHIKITGQQGINALDNMMQQSATGGASPSQGSSTPAPGAPPPMVGTGSGTN